MDRETTPFSLGSFFSFDRKQVIILVTIVFILVTGALYSFLYIPSNQRSVEALRFRAIQNIDRNINKKIENSVILMNQLLIAYRRRPEPVKAYIDSFPKTNFELSDIQTDTKGDSLLGILFDGEKVQIKLLNDSLSIEMKYTLPKFIEPLLSKEAFDNYLIIGNRGEIIYQTFPCGATELCEDSLQKNCTPFGDKPIRNIRLGGTDYKMFLQKIKLGPNNSVTIAGLLRKQKYQHLNTSLPEKIVVSMLFVLLAVILSLPWIKLYHIGNQDRLTVFDGLFAFVSSLLLIAFLVFAFMNYNGPMQPADASSNVSSKNLANSLKAAFKTDIRKAIGALSRVDSLRIKNKILGNLRNISKDISYQDSTGTRRSGVRPTIDLIPDLLAGLDVAEVFWLDRTGQEIYNYNKNESAPSASYADRSYYRQLAENRPYCLKDGKTPCFGLEQVVSWTTGSFVTVVSKSVPVKDTASYAAIAFNPRSVTNPLLPAGFTFAITDQLGNVLYHSNPFKNLNENLTEEFADASLLREALRGNAEVSIHTKYSGTACNVYVSPFGDLPYYMIIFDDTNFTSVRGTKVFVFTFTLLLLFFAFLVVHFLVIYLLYQRPSFLKKHYFDITWLGPSVKFKPRYLLVLGLNCFIILLLLTFAYFTSFLQFLFILLLSATASSIFLNSQYKMSYFKTESEKFRQKKKAIQTLWGIMGLIVVGAMVNTDFDHFLYFGMITAVFSWSYVKYTSKVRQRRLLILIARCLPLSHCFTAMVSSRLIIMSALPVAYFFIASYNYESSLIGTYRHRQFHDEFIRRNATSPFVKDANMFYDEVWIAGSTKPDMEKSEVEGTAKWLFEKLTGYITHDGETSYSGAQNAAGYSLYNEGITITTFPGEDLIFKRLVTAPVNYKFPTVVRNGVVDWKGISFWSIFVAALVLFVFLLHRVIRKLFALNLPRQTGWDIIDKRLLLDNSLNSRLFFIGPWGSSILQLIVQEIDNGRIKGLEDEVLTRASTYIADMLAIPENEEDAKKDSAWLDIQTNAVNTLYKLIIVNHFEYDLKSVNTNRIKLNFLERLKQRKDCKIIIVSTVHPVNFLESLNQLENKKPVGERQPEHDLERWHTLLSHFRIIVKGLRDIGRLNSFTTPAWEKSLKSELRFGEFLHSMQGQALTALKTLPEKQFENLKGDSLAFKMEITSHYYYMGLWQSLTKEEKFLLYDLAEDGLVNPFDDYNLTLLIRKGLILQDDGGLRVFNTGFRHFILTAIGTSEALKIRSQIKDNGTWNSLRIPLTILIVAVFTFLFASQQEAYETLLKYLSVLTISVPAALKFFAMFEKTPKSE
ncbi:cache domain-containing protein [Dyadobacter sp. OTU695]|uniref:cache domain-containing protein n=1 Tax=Dyadobacter sp. OTU695 TaxID=3043860 RepID=UPI00313C67F8